MANSRRTSSSRAVRDHEQLRYRLAQCPIPARLCRRARFCVEVLVGIARTWDRGRKASGVWFHNDEEEHRKKRCPGRNYHLVKNLRVPTIPQAIRTNKFIGVGDDETACICSRPSPQCHRRCVHREQIARIKYLKKKNREAIPAPVAEDMDELDCIE